MSVGSFYELEREMLSYSPVAASQIGTLLKKGELLH